MKKSTKRTIQKAAITATTFLFGFLMAATPVLYDNESTITGALGQTDHYFEEVGELPEGYDTEYGYKSQYANLKEVAYGGFEIMVEEQIEGTVLLKNDNNALPLAKGSDVSLFGTASVDPCYGGTGSGGINTSDKISWYDAIAGKTLNPADPRAAGMLDGDDYFDVNTSLQTEYTAWNKNSAYKHASKQTSANIGDVPWSVMEAGEGVAAIKGGQFGEAAIMIIKRFGGEGYDLAATSSTTPGEYSIDRTKVGVNDGIDGDYLQLNANEKSILAGLKALKDEGKVKKIIVILNSASTVQLDFLNDAAYGVDACVWAGTVGEFGTVGVTKLLCGEENFSGGLSTTLWHKNIANPVNANFSDNNYYFQYENYADFEFMEMENQSYQSSFTTYLVYQEGMYLGYKYTETRYEDFVAGKDKVGDYKYDEVVAYPFGHGLSYTNFEFSNLKVVKEGSYYNVSVDVKNTGTVAGKTPVQIYVAKPYGDYEKAHQIQVPSVQLVDFGKTSKLAPNASETVTVKVREKYFATYDTFGAGTWVLTPGEYNVVVARNAHDAVNNLLAKKGFTPANTNNRMDATGDVNMVYTFNQALDTQTYSTSTATGRHITNAFEFVDINTYSGKGNNSVKYYSREDWNGTVKLCYYENGKLVKPYAKLLMTQQMADEMRNQMDADVVMVPDDTPYPTYGRVAEEGEILPNWLSMRGKSYDDLAWDAVLDQMTWKETFQLLSNGRHKTIAIQSINKAANADENGPNGFSATYKTKTGGSNWSGPTNPYAERINDPDIATKYTTTGFCSNGILAATFNKEVAAKVGKQMGEEAYWAGISGQLGTGLNIQRSTYAGRTVEYYSEDAILSGQIAAPQTAAMETMGVHAYIKHCAINESETARHGVNCWMTEQTARENYFRAFEIAIEEGGAWNVMTSFSRIGVWAVANSVEFAQDFLRKECGLPGIVETDCAGDMTDGKHGEAYVSRIVNVYTQATDLNEYNYGDDLPDYTGSDKTWASFAPESAGGPGGYGKLGQSMRESVKRILYATVNSNAVCGMSPATNVVKITPPWEHWLSAANIISGVLMAGAVAWLVVDVILGKKNAIA